MAHKEAVVSLLHDRNYHMLADNPHVTVIDGEGSFVDSHTVSVRAGDERLLINAPRIFINTGAEPIIPPITGIEDSRHVYTSTELLDHPPATAFGGNRRGLCWVGVCVHVRQAGQQGHCFSA